jgi:hypothetical protein
MTDANPAENPQKNVPAVDSSVPHPARMYDYLLGGDQNFPVDREMAEKMFGPVGIEPTRRFARANRNFLGRAVRYLVHEAGIRQFLDIGTGIPNADNVHAVAQKAAPEARIVYVDNDPLVLIHANTLLDSTPEGATSYIDGDLRSPQSILLRAAATLDFSEPVALMLVGILHMVADSDQPFRIVAGLLDAIPSGSYLVVSHMATDIHPEKMAEVARTQERVPTPMAGANVALRPFAEVSRFLDGLELVDPGLVRVDEWRPDPDAPADVVTPIYGAIGRKP